MTAPIGLMVETERALDWVRGSLAQGSGLATFVRANLATLTVAVLLVEPARAAQVEPGLDDNGRGLRSSEADDVARRLLASAASTGKLTLIVEDDLGRRGDPRVERAAFVGDRVLRWEEVGDDVSSAATLLRKGSSGYPLNAYLCSGAAADLGLAPEVELSRVLQQRLAETVIGVIVSVWDAEAFVGVLSPSALQSLGD
jgi:hypothetical protein